VDITSARNPVIKYVRSFDRAQIRRAEGAYVVEGQRLVREAIDTQQRATLALYDPDALLASASGSLLLQRLTSWAQRSYTVSAEVLTSATQTETPAGVLVVLERGAQTAAEALSQGTFGLLLDRLSDPGNAGAIIRSAAASGVSWIASLPDTVDLYGPKVMRAGMGAHFRLPIVEHIAFNDLRSRTDVMEIVALDALAPTSVYDFTWPEQVLLVVGSEAHGLSPEIRATPNQHVRIPMQRGIESLNAAVSAAIVMYSILGPRMERVTNAPV